MNKQGPKGIGWLRGPNGEPGYTWNPIKGLCPVGCFYCYARRYYQRFKLDPKPCLSWNELEAFGDTWKRGCGYQGMTNRGPKKPSRIFTCSTFELFHPVADKWRDEIFQVIERHPEHTFIILTKMPERIDRPMPDNVWLGVTVTDFNDYTRKMYLLKNTKRSRPKILFASYEPILGPLPPEFIADLDWIIMGRLTGHGNKKNPDLRLLDRFAWECQDRRTPLFMKDNLRSIWPGKLIQEMPR